MDHQTDVRPSIETMIGVFDSGEDNSDASQFAQTFGLKVDSSSLRVLADNDIRRLDPMSDASEVIKEYFADTKPVNYQLMDIWSVNNDERNRDFVEKGYDQLDSLLLYHGTKRANLASILETGLKPMRFPNIFFADRLSMSAAYTDGNLAEVVLLCQATAVESSKVFNTFSRSYTAFPKVADISNYKLLDNCLIQFSPTDCCQHPQRMYLVADRDSVRIKFILHCQRTIHRW